jgi:hypothetical protein
MLWSVSDRKMRQISSAANQPSRRRPARTPQSEQRLKRGHRGFSAVMSKRKLVEIDLHMVTADAMVRADEPLLQVADRAVGQGHDRRHATPQSGFVRLGAANVPNVGGLHAVPPFQAVGGNAGRGMAVHY